jgi:hypothetical protein
MMEEGRGKREDALPINNDFFHCSLAVLNPLTAQQKATSLSYCYNQRNWASEKSAGLPTVIVDKISIKIHHRSVSYNRANIPFKGNYTICMLVIIIFFSLPFCYTPCMITIV